jgi:hypothetical protein
VSESYSYHHQYPRGGFQISISTMLYGRTTIARMPKRPRFLSLSRSHVLSRKNTSLSSPDHARANYLVLSDHTHTALPSFLSCCLVRACLR